MTAPRRMTYSRAHPRSRGEHTSTARPPRTYAGSSPLARGTRGVVGRCHRRRGLIPARAGNTNDREGHRRCRGGSSPLARGTRGLFDKERAAFGLIPARAGNTFPDASVFDKVRAHPRSRGEHIPGGQPGGVFWGSSPLARGPLALFLRGAAGFGLIPARAGNTRSPAALSRSYSAHPRSRGEHRKYHFPLAR